MNHSRISIKDIARMAGVSHTTVSRALRDSPLISIEVRRRIQRLARELGYTPNAVAQSLQTRRTNTIGLVVTSIADPFYAEVVRGIEEAARPAGFSVFLNASYNDPDHEIHVVETFHHRRVDGILVASSRVGSRYADQLERMHVPVVLVNSQAENDQEFLHSVAVDDHAGARLVGEHLLALGHRQIGYVGVSNRPRSNERRRAGLSEALAAVSGSDLVVISLDSRKYDKDAALGRAALAHLRATRCTAVFCYNDMVAIGILLACREHGIKVPRDLSVVGFDDIEFTQYVTPPLTTVHQPKYQLGQLAMQMLLDVLDQQPVQNVVLQPKLQQRESTAPPQVIPVERNGSR